MNAIAADLIETGVPWLVKIIVDACKGEPAPTQAEIQARIDAAIDARKADPDWLGKLLKDADAGYAKPTAPEKL